MDFFDDDATGRTPADSGGPPAAPSHRRRPDRRRTRIQRIVILAVILFVVVFGLAWWARSCQHSRKVDTYRTYFDGVTTAINDSASLGKQVSDIVKNPTKLSLKELTAKLDRLTAQQDEIAVRAGRLEPPGTLKDEQSAFASGMKIRASGFQRLQTLMLAALGNKQVGAQKIAAVDGFFSGPDAYYQDLVYLPARTVMADDGVTGVAVPESDYYLTWKALDPAMIESMLSRVGSSSKLTGTHGVGLISVTAQSESGDIKLEKGKSTNVPASASLAFVVKVQNQGSVAENDVPVTATLTIPGGDEIVKEATIASINADQSQTVTLQGFAIPAEALSKTCTLKVVAGPVEGELVETNNSAQYKLVLQLKEG